jgi:hypothetical protein
MGAEVIHIECAGEGDLYRLAGIRLPNKDHPNPHWMGRRGGWQNRLHRHRAAASAGRPGDIPQSSRKQKRKVHMSQERGRNSNGGQVACDRLHLQVAGGRPQYSAGGNNGSLSLRRGGIRDQRVGTAPQQENVLVAGQAIAPWISEVAADVFLHPAPCDGSLPVRIIAEKKPG